MNNEVNLDNYKIIYILILIKINFISFHSQCCFLPNPNSLFHFHSHSLPHSIHNAPDDAVSQFNRMLSMPTKPPINDLQTKPYVPAAVPELQHRRQRNHYAE